MEKYRQSCSQIAHNDLNNSGFSLLPMDLKGNRQRAKLVAATIDFLVQILWYA